MDHENQNSRLSPIELWLVAIRRAFTSKPFLIALGFLIVTAFGMGAATQFMQLKFRKEPVPLRRDLLEIPRELGHWRQISDDEPLDADIEHTLGTKMYVFRDYVDTRLVGETEIEEMMSQPNLERKCMLAIIEQRKPQAVIHMGVTYYTGMVDTVAHVPDRCYIADGYAPTEYEERDWKISESEKVRVRFINFEDATGFTSRVSKNVAYLFQVNGEMESSPLAVRRSLQNLFRSDVYYSKIELMTMMKNREDAARVMQDFLQQALPEIRKCLPASEAASEPAAAPAQAVPATQAAESTT